MDKPNSAHQVLRVIYEQPEAFEIRAGIRIVVRKIAVRDIDYMLSFIEKVTEWVGVDNDGNTSINLADRTFMFSMLKKYQEEIKYIISTLTNLSEEAFDDLELDDALLVVEKVIGVNYTFFMERVMPMVLQLKTSVLARQKS